MTRTEKLAKNLHQIYQAHKAEISVLPRRGPRGGNNAASEWAFGSWEHCYNQTVTKACNLAGIPTLPYWSGSAPTPATAIPACLAKQAYAAYKKIFAV